MALTGSHRLLSLITLLFLLSPWAKAAPAVTATVDTNTVTSGELIHLSVTVSSDSQMQLEDIKLPIIPGFAFVDSSVNQQLQQKIVNGEVEMVISQVYMYRYQAQKPGKYTIPPIEVTVNGESHRTQPINMTVTAGGAGGGGQRPQQRQQNPQQDDEDDPFFDDADSLFQQLLKRHGLPGGTNRPGPQPKINPDEAFFIQLEADKNEVYVGEQVTATWYIYTRNTIQNIDTLKYPNLRAFIKEDIEIATRLDWRQEVINGIPYRKALLVSYALFPMKEGVATIDSYKAKCTVAVGGGPFGFGQSYTFTKASQEVKVKVKAIPAAGRPADYSGGVGQFQIKANVENTNVAANQPFALKIRFEGRGNAKSIDLPALDLPKTLEVYSQRDETKFNREGTSYKEFEVLLIPRESGKITIPKITMSFFNPQSGSFYQGSTDPIEMNVGAGKGGGSNNVEPITAPQQVRKSNNPELLTEWESYKGQSLVKNSLRWILVYVILFLFITWRVFVEFQIGAKRKSTLLRMNRKMKVVHGLIAKNDWRKVGAELTNAIYLVVGAITGEEGGSSVQLDKLFESLAPSLKKEFEKSLKEQLSRCETLSFAPDAVVGNQRESAQLQKLAAEVEALLARFIKAASAAENESN